MNEPTGILFAIVFCAIAIIWFISYCSTKIIDAIEKSDLNTKNSKKENKQNG